MATYNELSINQKINYKASMVNKSKASGNPTSSSNVIKREFSSRYERLDDLIFDGVRTYQIKY